MPTREKRAKQLGCSVDELPDSRGQHGNHSKGSSHHRWKNGAIITKDSYKKTRVGLAHPLADPNGYAIEHVLIWVSAGNPIPEAQEILHHKNGDRQDNRLENLELMTSGDHTSLHLKTRKRDRFGRFLPRGTR